ncbi:MAG: O-antigen ligase family protein, partial [Flavisolibacter sp.]
WLALTLGLISYLLIRLRLLFVSFLLFIILCAVSLYWLNRNDNYLRFSNDYKTTIFHPDFKEHLLATYEMKDMSTAERFYRWVAGVRMIKDSWKTGFGPTTFYQNYKSYTEPAFKTWVSKNEEHSTVHNYYLLMIIEQGVMGLFLFILLLGTSFWYSQYLYSKTGDFKIKIIITCIASLLVMISTIIFLSDMIETDKIGSIFYLAISSLILTDYKTEEKQSDLSTNI